MAAINLSNEHKPLVKAAIKMGDWLGSLSDVSDSNRDLIKRIQQALNKLPKVNDGTLAMYGYSIERGSMDDGLVRGWDISLEYFTNDVDQQGGLELFSSYIPLPETNDPKVLADKKNAEVYFHWALGETCSFIDAKQQQQWITEVMDPHAFMQPGDRLRVELVFGPEYAEIDCQI